MRLKLRRLQLVMELLAVFSLPLLILRDFDAEGHRELATPVVSTQDQLSSVEYEHCFVEVGLGEVILEDRRAQCELVKPLLLLAAGEGRVRVEVVRLVDPHVEAHLTVHSRSSNQPLVDELGLDYCLRLYERQSALLNLAHYRGLVVIWASFLLVYRSVDLEVSLGISDEIVLEHFLFEFLWRVLFCSERYNVCRTLTIVVHLELVGFGKMRVCFRKFF